MPLPHRQIKDPEVRQNFEKLEGLFHHPAATVRRAANQAVTTGGFGNLIEFDTVDYDDDQMFNASVDDTVLVVRKAGVYALVGKVTFASNATGRRFAQVAAAGSGVDQHDVTALTGLATTIPVGGHVYLEVGDEISLVALQTSGGDLNATARLSAHHLSGP